MRHGRWRAVLLALLASTWATAAPAPATAPRDLLRQMPPLATTRVLELPAINADTLRAAADAAAALRTGPMEYGVVNDLAAATTKTRSAAMAGEWSELPDGRHAWRMEVESPGALTLDFGFAPFRLPASAELWITGADGAQLGPYTDRDNTPWRSLHTPLLAGDRATVVLLVDASERAFVEIGLADVASGFRPQDGYGGPQAKANRCNVDVACPQADPWRQQVASVAHYTFRPQGGGTGFCSGSLLIDADGSSDQRLFATADHCLRTDAEARSMVFYWGYESDTCRPPGSAASGQFIPISSNAAATSQGARHLASHRPSDFTLVRLETPVPEDADAFVSGWDRVADSAATVASIHHPQGHEKRISVERDAVLPTTQTVSFTGGLSLAPGHAWDVTGWDDGTTEGGSSGSGLWNQDGRLIGVLSGGSFGCGNWDVYGRLKTAWDGGGTASTRLRDWLDPSATGATTTDGSGSCQAPTAGIVLVDNQQPTAGSRFRIRATASGGAGGYSYAWDLDDDGVIDRAGEQGELEVSYPSATSTQLRVTVTDAAGCSGSASRALDIRGPQLSVTAQPPQALCGNGDDRLEPGERWRLPLVLRNDGDATFSSSGRALVVPTDAAVAAGLRLETPAPTVPVLAPGASTTVHVDLFVAADAACGAPLALDLLGAANASQSVPLGEPLGQRVLDTVIGGGQACNVSACSASVPQVDARHGLFYQHARSGNGLLNFVYPQAAGDAIYGAVWYTARPDRSPQWYTVQGAHADNLGRATITRFRNSSAPTGYAPQGEAVGRAWIAQPAHDDVVFAWRFDDGRAGLELLHSAGVPFASPNRSQQWYAPAQSGWGAGVESNQFADGSYNEFWATFVYDDAGDGRWLVGADSQRQGTLSLAAFEVHCPGCPRLSDALARPRPAGSLSRQWTAPERGLLDTDILLPSPLSGPWQREAVTIIPLGTVEQP